MLQPLVMSLLLAMSVPFQFVDLAMSMSAKMETRLVPSARLDIRDIKVGIFFHAFLRNPLL